MPKNTLRATGGLNSDVEKYLLPKGDYIDAKNIVLDTSVSGGAGAVKTMEAISSNNTFSTGMTAPVVKASVVDNLGVLYVLVKGEASAKIFKRAEGDSTFTELLMYQHLVTTDFVPDLRKVGDTLVWNYHKNGTPLSWYVNRAPAVITEPKDISLIKQPLHLILGLQPQKQDNSLRTYHLLRAVLVKHSHQEVLLLLSQLQTQ